MTEQEYYDWLAEHGQTNQQNPDNQFSPFGNTNTELPALDSSSLEVPTEDNYPDIPSETNQRYNRKTPRTDLNTDQPPLDPRAGMVNRGPVASSEEYASAINKDTPDSSYLWKEDRSRSNKDYPWLLDYNNQLTGMTPPPPKTNDKWETVPMPPKGNGSTKITKQSGGSIPNFKVSPFEVRGREWTPTGTFEGMPEDNVTDTSDKDANRQRLLAYLGMGTQDAINGMTRFQGDTNVYDQMILEANKKEQNKQTKQNKINDYLKMKNAFTIKQQELALNNLQGSRKLDFEKWKTENTLGSNYASAVAKIKGQKDIEEMKGEGETRGMQKFGMNSADMAKDWLYEGGASRTKLAIETWKKAIHELETNPKLQPSMLNNYLTTYSAASPGKAEELYPEIHAMRQSIEATLLAALRPTFGAQFTENEGRMLLNTAFNPRLRPQDNIAGLKEWGKNLTNVINERERTVRWFGDHRGDMRDFQIVNPETEPIISRQVK